MGSTFKRVVAKVNPKPIQCEIHRDEWPDVSKPRLPEDGYLRKSTVKVPLVDVLVRFAQLRVAQLASVLLKYRPLSSFRRIPDDRHRHGCSRYRSGRWAYSRMCICGNCYCSRWTLDWWTHVIRTTV